MLQGHIFVFWGKEYVTQKKKGAHQKMYASIYLC